MGICFLHGNGGSGIKLPFRVIGGTTQPSNPEDGTIWVKTSVAMTHFEFTNPWSTAGVGVVCVTGTIGGANPTGTQNVVWAFNNKVGGIPYREKITLTGCKQVQGSTGNWVDLCAYVYYNGSWTQFSYDIDWSKYIVNAGTYKLAMKAEGRKWDSSFSANTFTVTPQTGSVKFNHTSGTGMVYWGPFDLTNATTLTIQGDFSSRRTQSDYYRLSVWSAIGTYISSNRVANIHLTDTGASVDVSSLSGNYYVGYSVRDSGTEIVTNFFVA